MYIDSSYVTRGDRTYGRHLLRTSYRENGKVKHETALNLSRYFSEEEIAALKLALKHRGSLAQLGSVEEVGVKQGLRIGAVFSLNVLAERVGLAGALGRHRTGRLALWQVLARCIDAGSRLRAVRLAGSHAACEVLGLEPFTEDHLYENLAWLAAHQEAIERRLFRRRYGQAPPQLFLYDVTSSYLEGVENVLAAFGYNRDGKAGKKQLVMGLLTGPDGTPVAVRVFEGNTPDPRTVAEQVRTLAITFGVQGVTLVGDRGMLKRAETEQLTAKGFYYITAVTKPQIRKLVRQGVFQLELFDEQVCEVTADGERYILRRNPQRAEDVDRQRQDKLRTIEQLKAEKSRYLEEHPRARTEGARQEVTKRVAKLRIDGWVQVVTRERTLEVVIDEAARREEAELDGCYVIKTDLQPEVATRETVHERYKALAEVEQAFRTFKGGQLELRPAFVRKEESTRGHVFTVMLAYLLERELDARWRHLDVTVPEGIDELGSLRGVELALGHVTCQKVPEPTGRAKQLLDAAGITLPTVLPVCKSGVATRKKLAAGRQSNRT